MEHKLDTDRPILNDAQVSLESPKEEANIFEQQIPGSPGPMVKPPQVTPPQVKAWKNASVARAEKQSRTQEFGIQVVSFNNQGNQTDQMLPAVDRPSGMSGKVKTTGTEPGGVGGTTGAVTKVIPAPVVVPTIAGVVKEEDVEINEVMSKSNVKNV